MSAHTTTALVILVVSAFVPALLFLAWVRRTERYGREPWHRVLRTFVFGAIFAVFLAIVLSLVLLVLFQEIDRVYVFSGRFPNLETIVLALVIAPFAEELAKGAGVYLARPVIDEPEDGLVYGAASGLGFAASENLLYGLATLLSTGSLDASLFIIGIRSVSSALLHAAATAAFGYGIAAARLWPGRRSAAPYYLLAVGMHSAFNALASLGVLYARAWGDQAAAIGLLAAAGLALVAFTAMRMKIMREDARRVRW